MVNVNWFGEFAFLFGRDVQADLNDGTPYSFEYAASSSDGLRISTPSRGTALSVRWKDASSSSTGESHELKFKFWPAEPTTTDRLQHDAFYSGWEMYEATMMTDNDQSDNLVWENVMEPPMVRVPPGHLIFHCERFELNMRNINTMEIEGRFVAHDFMLGGYLPSSYSCDVVGGGLPECNVEIYNPCHAEPSGGLCSAIDGEIFCGDNKLISSDSAKQQPLPLPNDTVGSEQEAAPIDIKWVGGNSFLVGKDVEAKLEGDTSDAYTFVDDEGRPPKIISGGGELLAREEEWEERGKNRRMKFILSQNEKDDVRLGWVVKEFEMSDSSGEMITWAEYAGGPLVSFLRVPYGYSVFQCEYVELALRDKVTTEEKGKYIAHDFTLGAFLPDGYEVMDYNKNEYNPCTQYNGGRCEIKDDVLSCGSVQNVQLSDLIDYSSDAGLIVKDRGGTSGSLSSGVDATGIIHLTLTALLTGLAWVL